MFFLASLNNIFCPIGAIIGSYFVDKFGRKRTFQVVLIISVISWVLVSTTSQSNKTYMYVQLIIGRCIVGIALGLTAAPSLIYVSEISHVSIRGRMTMICGLMMAAALTFVYIMGYVMPVSNYLLKIFFISIVNYFFSSRVNGELLL